MEKVAQSESPLIEDDQSFQRKMWVVQRCGWVVMAMVVLSALLGLVGPGPLSIRTVRTPSASLQLTYDRFVRSYAPTELSITLTSQASSSHEARLWINRAYIDHIEVQRITPRPIAVITENEALLYTFQVEDQAPAVMVTFSLQPKEFGSLNGLLRDSKGETIKFYQFAYP